MSADPKKFPVFKTIGQSIQFSFTNLGLIVRLSWLWIVVVIGASVALFFVLGRMGDTAHGGLFAAGKVLAIIALALLYVAAIYAIAVGWHRALLLRERRGWFSLSVGRRELKYVGYAFVISIAGLLPFAVGYVIFTNTPTGNGVAMFMVLLGVLIGGILLAAAVISRLSLVLPGTAVGDRRISFSESINLTRGNTWRLSGGLLLISLLNIIPNLLTPNLELGAAAVSSLIYMIMMSLLSILISVLLGFVALSYLSYSYWFFAPPPGEGDLV